jgi:hypothetical protein
MSKPVEQDETKVNGAVKVADQRRKSGPRGSASAVLTYSRNGAGSKPTLRAAALITPLRAAQGDDDVMSQEPEADHSWASLVRMQSRVAGSGIGAARVAGGRRTRDGLRMSADRTVLIQECDTITGGTANGQIRNFIEVENWS